MSEFLIRLEGQGKALDLPVEWAVVITPTSGRSAPTVPVSVRCVGLPLAVARVLCQQAIEILDATQRERAEIHERN